MLPVPSPEPAEITDLHIKLDEPEKSLIYPGPRRVTAEHGTLIAALLESIKPVKRVDFMVQAAGAFYRGRRDMQAVDGTWYRMRRIPDIAPDLDSLPSPLKEKIRCTLLSPHLTKGALVLITGGPGCGKTTTASAVVKSRLTHHAGICTTVEDPPEMPLNGWHGDGYCTQTWVAGDAAADWAESLRGALRSQPVGTNLMMYVGEVRDNETARTMIRAATNGFLVIGTSFGSGLVDGIQSFVERAGEDLAGALAAVLRVVVYQNIADDFFSADMLVSESPSSPVAIHIRQLRLNQLPNEIQFQRNRVGGSNDTLAR